MSGLLVDGDFFFAHQILPHCWQSKHVLSYYSSLDFIKINILQLKAFRWCWNIGDIVSCIHLFKWNFRFDYVHKSPSTPTLVSRVGSYRLLSWGLSQLCVFARVLFLSCAHYHTGSFIFRRRDHSPKGC